MHRSPRAHAVVRLVSVSAASLALIAAQPRPHATVRGVSYTEHHVTTSSGIGPPAGIVAPRNEYTEQVLVAGGRVRRELVSGLATDLYPKGAYLLGDRENGVIIVDAAGRSFMRVADGQDTLGSPVPSVRPSSATVAPSRQGLEGVSASLDTLGGGGALSGHPTERYRVIEHFAVYNMTPQEQCHSRDSASAPLVKGVPTMVARTTRELWLAPATGLSAMAAELVAVAGPWPTVGASRQAEALLFDSVRGKGLSRELLGRFDVVEAAMPPNRVALRTITTTAVALAATDEQVTTVDSAEIAAIQDVDIDESRLLLPDGFGEAQPSAPSGRGEVPAVPSRSAPWRVLPGASVAGARRGAGPRSFTISPPVRQQTTWDLDSDGALNLGTPGRWTITPRSSFTTTTMMWGAGGGASRVTDGAGGGGGFSTGTISFQSGTRYTLIVGAGGQGFAGNNGDCGGEGGFGGGGAGGAVDSSGEGGPGTPFSAGGIGYLGQARGNGAGGGGGGLSGLFAGTTPDRAGALLVAGGGGGGTFGATNGGAGGGALGESGGGPAPGGAGTDAEGGAPGPEGGATPGSAGAGGGGGYAKGRGAGGGGGSGYFGGGGGGQSRGGGGGGSGFVASTIAGGSTITGSGRLPAKSTDPRIGGAGVGGLTSGIDGAPGRIIILER